MSTLRVDTLQSTDDSVSIDVTEIAALQADLSGKLTAANNLSDLTDPTAAKENLGITYGYLGEIFLHPWRTHIVDGCAPLDGQAVDVSVGSTWRDLYDSVAAGNYPTTTETTWQADVTKRNCFVINIGDGRMRIPDYNGATSGSIPAPVWRGDAGGSLSGIQLNGVPNVTAGVTNIQTRGADGDSVATGAFSMTNSGLVGNTASGTAPAKNITLDLSTVSSVYRSGFTEVRMNSVVGCYLIRFAGHALNAGSLDAMTLATRIEQVNTESLNRDTALGTSIDAINDHKRNCTAWVMFNGVNPATIYDSFNVASVTRISTGVFEINFTTPMANTNYAPGLTVGDSTTGGTLGPVVALASSTTGSPVRKDINGIRVWARASGGLFDDSQYSAMFFGGK